MIRRLAFGMLASLVLSTLPARAEPREISVAVFFSEQSSTVREVLRPWADWVNKQVGDEIKIVIFGGGSLGRDPTKQLKMVEDKVADIAFVNFSFTRGRFPESTLFELPLLVRDVREGSEAISRMYKQGLIQGLDSIKVVSINTSPAVVLHTADSFQSLDGIAGWKIRSGGATENKTVERLNAVPVGLSPAEIAESISRGLIKGALLDWNATQTFHVSDVTTHHYDAALGGVLSFMLAMNKEVYQSLSEKARDVIDNSAEFINPLHVNAFSASVAKAREAAAAKGTILLPTEEEIGELEIKFQPLHDEWIQTNGSERYNALVEILKEVRKP